MTGLIPSPIALPDQPGALVQADGWFPPIALADLRAAVPIGGSAITSEQLTHAVLGAMLGAMKLLAAWRLAQAAAGAASLGAVSTQMLGGRNRAELLWQRAVSYYAAADLAGAYRDSSSTDSGLARGAEKAALADEFRRQGHAAIADLLSIGAAPVGRNRVELL